MSQPRKVDPGITYHITRNVLLDHDLLAPSAAITGIILYTLAFAAEKFDIQLHALCALPAQIQLVITDVEGKLPNFLQMFHRLVALGVKNVRGWKGVLWEPRPTCAVPLGTREVLVNAIAHVLGAPVAAGLVQQAADWSGAKVLVEELGRGVVGAARPAMCFKSRKSKWPEEATLGLTLPSWISQAEAEDLRRVVADLLAPPQAPAPEAPTAPAEAPAEAVVDAERAPDVSPTQPSKESPSAVLEAARLWGIKATQDFRRAYRMALVQWRKEAREVLFPPGTWWMRVFHGARVDASAG